MTAFDRRLHAFRPDLADARLEGQVSATRFSDGSPAWVAASVADLLREPRSDASLDTQLLCGDTVSVFEERGGFAWVQAEADGYVGYLHAAALSREAAPAPTHVVSVPRTFVYAGPDLKLPRRSAHSLGARLCVAAFAETRGTRYAVLPDGTAMIANHLAPAGAFAADYVAVAETLLRTPYLWGGTSAFGIDCAGLVQVAMRRAGRQVPRDSDMQAAALGEALDPGPQFANLRRGDLVFWRGHVAIMVDGETMIHANGHTMDVAHERLADAIFRIGYLYGGPTGFRRP